MHFVVHAFDRPDALATRAKHYSLFILEAKDRAAIDTFTNSDPYRLNGVWERVDVHYYNKKR